jgi:DME family drug/metabolite transporter
LMPLTAIAMSMPVALVSLLLYIYPAFTLILSRIWFGDKITIKKIVFVLIALVGVGCILGSGLSAGMITLKGVMVALGGGISLAFWACFGRSSGLKGYRPFDSLFWSEVAAVLLLIISAFIFPILFPLPMIGGFDFNFNLTSFGLLVALAIMCVVVGHTLFFYGVEKIKPLQASIIALFEPITAVVLSAILFSQTMSVWTLIGGILIFSSSILLNTEE